jgi:hypothetical protein
MVGEAIGGILEPVIAAIEVATLVRKAAMVPLEIEQRHSGEIWLMRRRRRHGFLFPNADPPRSPGQRVFLLRRLGHAQIQAVRSADNGIPADGEAELTGNNACDLGATLAACQ